MPDTVGDWLALVHALYPPAHAASWDNVGLQVGDPVWSVERVLVSLDVTIGVIEEATQDATPTLVLAHHPLLFRPLESLTPDTASGATALAAARAHVAVAAAHTNLDVAGDGAGTSDPVVRLLELNDVVPLTSEMQNSSRIKLVTFVPADHTEAVLDALAAAGAGTIGEYERCSFRVAGTGTFRPRAGAVPHSGEVGADNAEDEDRLEIEVPRGVISRVVRALLASHPYEEVAYDLVPLLEHADVGFGRVGTLPQPLPLRALAARIRDDLPAPHLRFAGNPDGLVRRVAVVGGAGDSLVAAALAADVDVYVTGDLRHHVTLDALERGLALVDAGHYATEVAALPAWIGRLQHQASARGLTAEVVRSRTPTDPWSG